jgi:uncharacterized membrane protein
VNAQTLIRPETGGDWQPLSAYPELADIAGTAENPPPPSAPAPSIGITPEAMAADYDLDIGMCVSESWSAFTRNFGLVLGGSVVFGIIMFGMWMFSNLPIIGLLMLPVMFVVTGPLMGGFYYFLLKNVRREVVDIGDVFCGFKKNLGSMIGGYLVPVLLTMLACVPGIVMMVYPAIQISQYHNNSALMWVMAIFGFILMLIPNLYLGISWMFTLPLVADKGLDFWSAMGLSRKRVGQHWWTNFGLCIVVGLINIVGTLACCVGLFAAIPVSFGAMMVAYERMFNVRTAATPLAGPPV